MNFEPSRAKALNKLNDFIEKNLFEYSKLRNFDFGPENRSNVSCLSPYITHGIICEKEVIEKSLSKFSFSKNEKFIQEVLWRTYWKGWLELRPNVWSDYLIELNKIVPDNVDLEINISCPNIKHFEDYTQGIENFINSKRKVIAKLAPGTEIATVGALLDKGFKSFHCCNTKPTKHGGMSGRKLRPHVINLCTVIKSLDKNAEIIPCKTFDDCFLKASKDESSRIIIPESNRITGNIKTNSYVTGTEEEIEAVNRITLVRLNREYPGIRRYLGDLTELSKFSPIITE